MSLLKLTQKTDHTRLHAESAWLQSHILWEANGEWDQIASWFEHLENATPRWFVAALRAYAFLDRAEKFHAVAQIVDRHVDQLDSECKAVRLLAYAARARREEIWKRAKNLALRAVVLARRGRNHHLKHDAEFALALCLASEGRFYLALDGFQRIARDQRASDFRRGLAANNEAWLLWDLGRPAAMAKTIDLIPPSFHPRVRVMLALANLDEAALIAVLNQPELPVLESEKTFIAILLLEWLYLSTDRSRLLNAKSWLNSFAPESNSELVFLAWHSLHQAQPIDKTGTLSQSDHDWRGLLDFQFMRMLSWIDHDPKKAIEIYKTQIDPVLEQQGIETTLIPSLSSIALRNSAWCRKLLSRLGLERSESRNSLLRVYRDRIEIISGSSTNEIAFKKSPTSIQLLRLLAGPKGRQLNKQYLHEQLTGTRYVSHLHDDRLHKLLRRLEMKIEDGAQIKLWHWPRNNHLELLLPIEVSGD